MAETVQINIQLGGGPHIAPNLGGTEDQLRVDFEAACAAFKNRDPTIGGLLAEDATVFSVSKQDPHGPRYPAEQFFAKDFSDNPQFDPHKYGDPNYNVTQHGRVGTVTGVAGWVDNNGSEKLKYRFTFTWDETVNHWLILVAWSRNH